MKSATTIRWAVAAAFMMLAGSASAQVGANRDGLVNANLGTAEELSTLPQLNAQAVEAIVEGRPFLTMAKLDTFPVSLGESFRKQCLQHRGALNAVIAARSCAMAVLTGEVDLPPEELAPEHADRVRREGWIYGLREPKAPSEETPPDA